MLRRIIFICVCMCLLCGCGGLSSDQSEAVDKALHSLEKIAASTEVGVTYAQYGQLIIDAKPEINKATSLLPDGDLKTELNEAMNGYADARAAWETIITGGGDLYTKYGPGETIIPKYNLPAKSAGTPSLGNRIDSKASMQVIWLFARNHMERAKAFRNNKPPPDEVKDAWAEALRGNKNSQ
jgi:hypothetical protein